MTEMAPRAAGTPAADHPAGIPAEGPVPGLGPDGAEVEPDGGSHDAEVEGKPGFTYRGSWLDYLVTMVVALVIAVLVKTFLVQPFYIPSASMDPTLITDDKIVVSKLTPGVFELERGDVVVFQDTQDWLHIDPNAAHGPRYQLQNVLSWVGLAPDPSQNHLVKRLIGLPGDHVVCAEEGGALAVNGVTLEEPYINPATPACQVAFDVTVPEDAIWVMGDNRFQSADSAWHNSQGQQAFVQMDDVTGKAVAVFWPISHWSGLNDGEAVFADVPDAS